MLGGYPVGGENCRHLDLTSGTFATTPKRSAEEHLLTMLLFGNSYLIGERDLSETIGSA